MGCLGGFGADASEWKDKKPGRNDAGEHGEGGVAARTAILICPTS